MLFDPLRRLRPRAIPPPVCPSSEEDSDGSSHERDPFRIPHVPSPKHARKPGEHRASEHAKGPRERTHIALTLDASPHLPYKKPFVSGIAGVTPPTGSIDAPRPPTKSTLIRRVTSKLNISIPSRSSSQALRSRPSTRTLPSDMGLLNQGPRSPGATIPASPTLPNSFVSKQHREAALRERGLLPPRKDLSEQEREADERVVCVPSPVSVTFDGSTEAEQFKANWLASNGSSKSTDPACRPLVPPYLQSPRSLSHSAPPPDAGPVRRSSEGNTDLVPAGRLSFCSSVPPLSTSSCLEVLHEDPSEQGPITPPPWLLPHRLPIIVSSLHDSPPSPIFAESPVSCTFSSHCPGSILEESQSQSSHHPSVPEKENIRFPVPRRRTTDSSDRQRKAIGTSLTRLGTGSLTNLRRSVVGSLKVQSTSTLSITSSSNPQVPRAAIDPTMHSLGSILRETRDVEDAESRRLCELAFLD